MDEPLTHEHFSPYVDTRFGFEGHHLTLLLRSVETKPQFAAPGALRIPFVLVFEGPAGDILPAALHQAATHDGSVFEMYVAPMHTPSRDRQDYQAIFN